MQRKSINYSRLILLRLGPQLFLLWALLLPAQLLAQQNGEQPSEQAEPQSNQTPSEAATPPAIPSSNSGDSPDSGSGIDPNSDYFTEVAVNGQTPEEQQSAYRIALRIVLLKNGDEKTLRNKDTLSQALAQVEKYVEAASYRVPGAGDRITRATPITPKVRSTNEATHLLSIQFRASMIANLLSAQQLIDVDDQEGAEPVIPNSALAWLLIDDGNGEHRIGGRVGVNIIERVHELAGGVGQQIIFPAQDALDQQALSAEDMHSTNTQRVLAASSRYRQSRVLLGVLIRDQDRRWSSTWSRYFNGSVADMSDSAPSLDRALQQGIDWLAGVSDNPASAEDTFTSQASGFARPGGENSGTIWIGGLQSVEAYASLITLINDVESVELVFPAEVQPDGMLFSISPRYALNDVSLGLSSINWLQPSSSGRQGSSAFGPSGFGQAQRQADISYDSLR